LGTTLQPGNFAVAGKARWLRTVSVASADLVFLQMVAQQFYGDSTPAGVGIGLGVVAERIKMLQIVPNGGKGSLFFSPVLGKVGLAACGRGHAIKHYGGDGLQL